jgi:transposase
MEHIGIDLGSKESQICVRSTSGEVLLERRCRTERVGAFLSGRPPGRVIVETCTEAFRVAAAAQRAGHEVSVVAATLVRSLGVGQRGLKNDVRDARVLSEASCRMELPSVHIPTVIAQEVKAICVSREALIKTRTQLIGRVRGYVRARLGRVLRATPESLPKRVRAALLEDPGGLPAHLERVLLALETISTQIAEADTELRDLAEADARMSRLMTVPGVGPVTAARFVAAIDRIERFRDAASVASYLGLVPGEHTTGFRTKRTCLTRAGAPQVRWALGQAVWSLYIRRKTDPMVQWAKRIAERRGAHVAIMALARKLSHVLYAMWKHETTYDPRRAARPVAA